MGTADNATGTCSYCHCQVRYVVVHDHVAYLTVIHVMQCCTATKRYSRASAAALADALPLSTAVCNTAVDSDSASN